MSNDSLSQLVSRFPHSPVRIYRDILDAGEREHFCFHLCSGVSNPDDQTRFLKPEDAEALAILKDAATTRCGEHVHLIEINPGGSVVIHAEETHHLTLQDLAGEDPFAGLKRSSE